MFHLIHSPFYFDVRYFGVLQEGSDQYAFFFFFLMLSERLHAL